MQIKIASVQRGLAKVQNNENFKCVEGFSIIRMHILLLGIQIVTSTLENYLIFVS